MFRIVDSQEMESFVVHVVSKYHYTNCTWHVSYCPLLNELKCSCLQMESTGLPCAHIVCILLFLDFNEFPSSLLLV